MKTSLTGLGALLIALTASATEPNACKKMAADAVQEFATINTKAQEIFGANLGPFDPSSPQEGNSVHSALKKVQEKVFADPDFIENEKTARDAVAKIKPLSEQIKALYDKGDLMTKGDEKIVKALNKEAAVYYEQFFRADQKVSAVFNDKYRAGIMALLCTEEGLAKTEGSFCEAPYLTAPAQGRHGRYVSLRADSSSGNFIVSVCDNTGVILNTCSQPVNTEELDHEPDYSHVTVVLSQCVSIDSSLKSRDSNVQFLLEHEGVFDGCFDTPYRSLDIKNYSERRLMDSECGAP